MGLAKTLKFLLLHADKAYEDRLAALRYLDGKFQLKHAPGAKKLI